MQLGNLLFWSWFRVLENAAVNVLLGTSFIYSYIDGIVPSKRKAIPWDSKTVPIQTRSPAADIHHYGSEEDRDSGVDYQGIK